MLSGDKPLAMFCDIVPSPYEWPDAMFEPHVLSGRLVQREMFTNTPDGRRRVRHLYYALPQGVWRIEDAHALALKRFGPGCPEADDVCVQTGRLLGYQEEDIQAFIQWGDRIRGHQRSLKAQ